MIAKWRRLMVVLVFCASTSTAHAIAIDVANFLDPVDFGVPEAVIEGVLERARNLWIAWLPSLASKPADHPQNAQFAVLVEGKDIDNTGVNPANTPLFKAERPSGDVLVKIEVNTNKKATDAMFWDPTPNTTTPAEFSIDLKLGFGRWKAANGDVGFGKFDMLTVVLHELGHALGFSRDYSDFSEWADHVWNPAHPENTIGTPAHFSDNNNLMSGGAGFPDGKSGRSFLQPFDIVAFQGAFGYVIREPAMPALLLVAMILAGIVHRSRSTW